MSALPKRWQLTNGERKALIRQLAAEASDVAVTRSAQESMARHGLTRRGVCTAICEYLDEGGPVDETITDMACGHVGELVYELHPTIDVTDYYVKVKMVVSGSTQRLVLISVHP